MFARAAVQGASADAEPWLRPHLAALEAAVLAGFRFVHPRKVDSLLAVQGFRIRDSAIDMFIAHSAFDAVAARVRVEEMRFEGPSPALWERRGAVADVVMELVALPPHGAPNAPKLARARSLDLLWVPGNAMS